MTKKLLAILLFLFAYAGTTAQIICIKCFNQTQKLSPAASNMVLNPSFELNNCGGSGYICPASGMYSCDFTNWTVTGGGNSTYAQPFFAAFGIVIPDGATTAYLGNYFCEACSATVNDTSCLTNIDCTLAGLPPGFPNNTPAYGGNVGVHLKQTINGLTVGSIYILEFWCGGEGPGFDNDGLFGLDLGFGPTILRCKESVVAQGQVGQRFYVEWRATSTSHTIEFINWGHICSTCTELVVDDLKLYPIAELAANITPCTLDTIDYFTLDTTICAQESVVYRGKTYNQTGTYHDSVVYTPTHKEFYTLNLTVIQCIFPHSFDTTLCEGLSYTFNGKTYSTTGTFRDTIIINPQHIDVYTINLTIDPCYNLFIPSAFTPNGDPINQDFKPIGKNFNPQSYKMIIFDRWGEEIFSTTDVNKGWNGTYKGKPSEIGTYYYLITFKFDNVGKSEQRKGDVTLLR